MREAVIARENPAAFAGARAKPCGVGAWLRVVKDAAVRILWVARKRVGRSGPVARGACAGVGGRWCGLARLAGWSQRRGAAVRSRSVSDPFGVPVARVWAPGWPVSHGRTGRARGPARAAGPLCREGRRVEPGRERAARGGRAGRERGLSTGPSGRSRRGGAGSWRPPWARRTPDPRPPSPFVSAGHWPIRLVGRLPGDLCHGPGDVGASRAGQAVAAGGSSGRTGIRPPEGAAGRGRRTSLRSCARSRP